MTHPTTQEQKYDQSILTAQIAASLARVRELLQASQDMAEDHAAAAKLASAHVAQLRGRINRARHFGHMVLNNPEAADDAWVLSETVAQMLAELEGDA